jgi:hypothetical protein
MTKNLKTIIEEEREAAAIMHDWDPEVARITPLAYLVFEFFEGNLERLDRLEAFNAQSVPELAAAIRAMVERDIVESTWLSKADLVLGFTFYALHGVDWEEVAMHVGQLLKEREETIEIAKKSGFLTLIEADDDLPKN